jgi:5-methylcytosine-specific restriction endonuclease McrA
MPWVRIDENALEHPKVIGLSDGAFRLWVQGLAHCQKYLTDGIINDVGVRALRAYSPKRRREVTSCGLWHEVESVGIQVHDYLQWNDSRRTVLDNRDWNKRRRELYSDPALLKRIRDRDGNCCRYCGKPVNWHDRRGPDGGTFDHVIARGPNTEDNVVVACRGCNASKGDRALAECGMRLLSVSDLVPELDSKQVRLSHHIGGVGWSDLSSGSGSVNQKDRARANSTVDQALGDRAGRFVERFAQLFAEHRKGAKYHSRPTLDFQEALGLCQTWDDERLERLVIAFLTTDDKFCRNGNGSIAHFRSRASWCDSKLRESGL